MNPLGNNTYFARGGKEVNFGDEELASVKNVSTMVTLLPTFVDVVTTEDCEFIYAVDRAYGRIFERDRNGNLISVFGALGNQEGTFKQPSAIALLNGDVLVLDTGKSSVTVFEPSCTRLCNSTMLVNTLPPVMCGWRCCAATPMPPRLTPAWAAHC